LPGKKRTSSFLQVSGVSGIITSENLVVPEDVITQKEDLASELAVLWVKLFRNKPSTY
jgi:NADH/NAD ratio-sensing transcriptional regulator Rex